MVIEVSPMGREALGFLLGEDVDEVSVALRDLGHRRFSFKVSGIDLGVRNRVDEHETNDISCLDAASKGDRNRVARSSHDRSAERYGATGYRFAFLWSWFGYDGFGRNRCGRSRCSGRSRFVFWNIFHDRGAWLIRQRRRGRRGNEGTWTSDCSIVVRRGRDESTGYGRSGSEVTIGESAFLPVDIWVDSFEPRHSQNHLVRTEGSNEERFLVFNTSEGKLERNHAIGMKQLRAVRDGDIDWLTGYSDETQCVD